MRLAKVFTDKNFKEAVLNNGKITLIAFTDVEHYRNPALSLKIEEVAKKFKDNDRVLVGEMGTEQNVANEYSVPDGISYLYFENGEEVEDFRIELDDEVSVKEIVKGVEDLLAGRR